MSSFFLQKSYKKYASQINIQLNCILVSFLWVSKKSLEKAANFVKESYGTLKWDCILI